MLEKLCFGELQFLVVSHCRKNLCRIHKNAFAAIIRLFYAMPRNEICFVMVCVEIKCFG